MSIYGLLKWIALIPFRMYHVEQPLHTFGDGDCWKVFKPQSLKPTVLAAGVGHRISFEEQLASELDGDTLLVDPTPTGITTISNLKNVIPNIEYQQVGLAAKSQVMAFSPPRDPEEGSFSLASDNNDTNVHYQCFTVDTLAASRNWNHIDI